MVNFTLIKLFTLNTSDCIMIYIVDTLTSEAICPKNSK